MRRWLGALLVALALAGCGSSGLTPSQLRTSATRICGVANQELNTIALPEAPSAGQHFISRGIAVLTPEVAKLRALRGTGTFQTAVAATAAELAALRFTLKGLRAGNDPVVAIKTLEQRLLPLETRANTAWRTLSISSCVSR
ncbi:MAG TPA: hypothetical protein VII87_04320 [Solirubrobacteraceae bacterium]|jgi:hypothetical protein